MYHYVFYAYLARYDMIFLFEKHTLLKSLKKTYLKLGQKNAIQIEKIIQERKIKRITTKLGLRQMRKL